MVIEYLTTGLTIGGAEKVVFDLAGGMRSRGHHVSVTSLIPLEGYADALRDRGIHVRSLGIDRRRKDSIEVLRALRSYRKDLRRRQPKILHAHMIHANLFGRAAAAFQSRTPLICTVHSTVEGGLLRDLAYMITNWTSTLNTTVSRAATQRYVSRRVLPRDTLTVYNGIDVTQPLAMRPDTGSPFRWLAVGRLEPDKDYPTLLRAVSQLHGARLTIAGDGSLREELVGLSSQLGIADRITFLGTRSDIRELHASHDAFVLSSINEGFGLALAEAMASGVPVIATRSGGPSEVIGEDGNCGILVEPGDSRALAAAMHSLQGFDSRERREMGMRGSDRISSLFGLGPMLDRWEAIYANVLLDPRDQAH